MYSKIVAMAIGVFSCAIFSLHGEEHEVPASARGGRIGRGCGECAERPFYTGKDTAFISLNVGDPYGPFVPLTFSQGVHVEGRGIYVESPAALRLKRGCYLVSYSGTSRNQNDGEESAGVFEYALFLDGRQEFVFSDSSEESYDATRLASFSTTIWTPASAELSIQARLVTQGAQGQIQNRSLVVQKLK